MDGIVPYYFYGIMFWILNGKVNTATTMNENEAAGEKYLPLLWPVQQSGATVKPNDVILTNLMMSHCFNLIPL